MSGYSESDCIEALQKAEERLGKSPTRSEYHSLDILPSSRVLKDKFGSWNKAKKAAGLETQSRGRPISDIPENVSLGKEKWRNLESTKRATIIKRAEIAKIKVESGCERCGYSKDPWALDFHHMNEEEKNFAISQAVAQNVNIEDIKEEMKKCKILCANCHREITNGSGYLSV